MIASRMGGLPYIVEEGKSGLLFESGQAAELAQKVQYLADHPDKPREWVQQGAV